MSSDVVSVRVPKELKEKMRKYDIDWAEEIRKFLEKRVKSLEALEVLEAVGARAQKRRTRFDSARVIREARDEHW
ncbi:CopG family transcriptional regulator [Pyrodictium abyssi]|uniref:Antitoxin n=1 Tax=Pyrodictium abyssi TaxID=54256 RepID=A0ABM8J0C3_9CREN|nr:hypothetical protein PABY_17620 [Pyrodictium abyssi]